MGERQVLNKYYPPDFDPSKLPRVQRSKNQQKRVRTMLPMSIRCNTCGDYISRGTKFNSRKEDVVGETYKGIQIFRFYIKCNNCSAELAIKMDPQNSDYVVEAGARRNLEPWRNEDVVKEEQKRESEEMGDAMKSLENRTLDSKREMDNLAALDELNSMQSRHATVSSNAVLEAFQHTVANKEKRRVEEDEAVLKSIVFHNSKDHIRRIHDADLDDDEALLEPLSGNGESSGHLSKRQKLTQDNSKPADSLTKISIFDGSSSRGKQNGSEVSKIIFKSPTVRLSVIKKSVVAKVNNLAKVEDGKQVGEESKNLTGPDEEEHASENNTNGGSNVLQSLCQNYDSDDSDE
ncbi:uncharacterized protein LOC126786120 [Argentina anserina]|uniref:uncharacterized protein LOC126786120 n=1 Tax=Argentina anserina TaxID=57926 RepID=UPI0021764620|nr:uncharacterized protein LOC126786120 [Potentilla anserina]